MSLSKKIVLASSSPRRQQLLAEMGYEFTVRLAKVDESFPENLQGAEVASFLCKKKAMAFAEKELLQDEIIITADTIVCLNDKILNKPGNRDEAIGMLQMLSGQKHEVITGICLRSIGKIKAFTDCTEVYFKELSAETIEHYVDHYKPYDKAGSYGIQEWIGLVGIAKIDGSYFNVMGLPTARLKEELEEFVLS
ncbi:MAG TPA: Maf family nucleotide pyrophosphatase [Bacteroidales bacterium]|nr:Maf family nucleotide pyrophosphatase [Bacteroidales bacterium]